MKLIIDIPKEFEKHFNEDRFKDSLERIECDIQDDINKEHTIPAVSGLRELELIDMLIKAFEKAESFHSTCILKGTPVYNDAPAKLCVVPTKEIYKLRDTLQKLSNDKWESFERSGCSDRYLQGKAHAYSIVVDMIDDLLEDNLGDDTNA